jgi:hypothetical protein
VRNHRNGARLSRHGRKIEENGTIQRKNELTCFCFVITSVSFYFFLYYFLLYRTLRVSRLFFSLDLYTIDRTPWTSGLPVARPLPKHQTKQTQNNSHTHTKSPCLEWDPKPPSQRPRERRQFMP